jgi:hypothetical protein
MNPINTAILAGAMIVMGKWARGQSPNIDNAVGIGGVAIGLSLLEQFNQKFSRTFGVLILISVAVVHLPTIVKALGFEENK